MQLKMARLNDGPEIFHSIQGEGRTAGRPSVFARASLCNLHCVWCDTDYTWNWEGTTFAHNRDSEADYRKFRKQDEIVVLSPSEAAESIARFACPHVVITGGEPMLQQAAWVEVMRKLRERDPRYWFEVETNGTRSPVEDFQALVNQYNVSPKLNNSKIPRSLREVESSLRFFARDSRATFKYVVTEPADMSEILSQVERFQIDRDKVYLMPEGLRERATAEPFGMVGGRMLAEGIPLFGSDAGSSLSGRPRPLKSGLGHDRWPPASRDSLDASFKGLASRPRLELCWPSAGPFPPSFRANQTAPHGGLHKQDNQSQADHPTIKAGRPQISPGCSAPQPWVTERQDFVAATNGTSPSHRYKTKIDVREAQFRYLPETRRTMPSPLRRVVCTMASTHA